MKRKITILFLSLVIVCASTAKAQFDEPQKLYDHSIGGNIGTLLGLTYKTMVTPHFSIGADFGVKFMYVPTKYTNLTAHDLELNMNFMYNAYVGDNAFFYFGAGFSLGWNWAYSWKVVEGYVYNPYWYPGYYPYYYPYYPRVVPYGSTYAAYRNDGKFGANAIIGFEFADNESPIAVSFDFRPGYGMLFNSFKPVEYKNEQGDVVYSDKGGWKHIDFFDWSLNIGIRYTF